MVRTDLRHGQQAEHTSGRLFGAHREIHSQHSSGVGGSGSAVEQHIVQEFGG